MNIVKRHIPELEKLFNEYYTALLLYSTTIVKNQDNAADIVQRAFISLWQKKDSLNIHTSARAYLYKTVYNASLDFLKHEKVKKRYQSEIIASSSEISDAGTHEDKALQQQLATAMNELPEQCGRIFKMSRLEGMKYREIAGMLKISEKTVEHQMGKALKLLRIALKDYLPLLLILLKF